MRATPKALSHLIGPAASYEVTSVSAAFSVIAEGELKDNVAVIEVSTDGESTVRETSYHSLRKQALRIAHALSAAGLKPGEPVVVAMERSASLIASLLGILEAGGVFVPIDLGFPAARIRTQLGVLGDPPLALTDPAGRSALENLSVRGLDVKEALASSSSADAPEIESRDTELDTPAYVMFTSGSTGVPKGVTVSHRNILRLVCNPSFARLNANTRMLQLAPVAFDASILEIWGPLLQGGRCVLYPGSGTPDLEVLEAIIRRMQISTMWLTAALFNHVVDVNPAILQGVEQLLVGGETVSPDHIARAMAALPQTEFINGYGPTENTTFTTCYSIPRTLFTDGQQAVPIGGPITNTQVRIVDDEGHTVSIGNPGELIAEGDGVALGYWNDPVRTKERFGEIQSSDGRVVRTYKTGDRAKITEDGVIAFLGRSDGQIKLHGHRLELEEIQGALRQLDGVSDATAALRPHKDESVLVGYVVLDKAMTHAELSNPLLAILPRAAVPTRFVAIQRFPLSPTGKLDRTALFQETDDAPGLLPKTEAANKGSEPAPATREQTHLLTAKIRQIWSTMLEVDEGVSENDEFFSIGGTSMLALRFVSAWKAETGRSLPVAKMFEGITPARLAAYLTQPSHKTGQKAPSNGQSPWSDPSHEGKVAIVGMAGRFPGGLHRVHDLWTALLDGRETTTYWGLDELDEAVDPSMRSDPAYVPARGVTEDIEAFDAERFDISRRQAELLDPQQRKLLEVAEETLEDAGVDPSRFAGRVGVWAGVRTTDHLLELIARRPDVVETMGRFQIMAGHDKDYAASRISHLLGLTGPAVSIHTACSTSLVAVHEAVTGLLRGDCEVALAGAASISIPQRAGHVYNEGGMLSVDGTCRPFDHRATGTVFSDGVAMVALKRLEDAVADGDDIYAVVLGSAVNNDGANKASFTAPSPKGQEDVIRAAVNRAGVSPETIEFIEAHGTATPLGDPIEVEALLRVYGRADAPRTVLGSIKSNFGHLTAAAGVAGLIKAAWAVREGVIPPTVHFEAPNPHIDFGGRFRVSAARETFSAKGSRRAAVSSFGVGGTNAHVVLEAPPKTRAQTTSSTMDSMPRVLALSAHHPALLDDPDDGLGTRLAASIEENPEALDEMAYTLATGRRRWPVRRAYVATTANEAIRALRDGTTTPKSLVDNDAKPRRVVLSFPGQGSQYPRMGHGLAEVLPVFADHWTACRKVLEAANGALDAEDIARTSAVQPALFAVEYAMARTLMESDVQPEALIGHSVGEFVAAGLAGVFSMEEGLHLVATRGRLMDELPPGRMLSIRLASDELEIPDGLDLAAVNGPALSVVAGPEDALERYANALIKADVACKMLRTAHAFHSRAVDPAVEKFRQYVKTMTLEPRLDVPIASTRTGQWLTVDEVQDPNYWAEHMRHPVRFADAVEMIGKTWGEAPSLWVECGPGQGALGTMARATLRANGRSEDAFVAGLSMRDESTSHEDKTADEARAWARLLAELWTRGADVALDSLVPPSKRRRVSIPTTPLQRTRYWLLDDTETKASSTPANQPASTGPSVTATPPQGAISQAVKPESPEPIEAPVYVASLSNRLRDLLCDLSGEDDLGPDVSTFIELGFDSLLLTQVATAVRRKFGVDVSYRQLSEELVSPQDLMTYLRDNGVKDAPEAPVQVAPTPAMLVAPASIPNGSADLSSIVDNMQQQLLRMQAQLDALRTVGSTDLAPSIGNRPSSKPKTEAVRAPKARKSTPPKSTAAPKRHGPQLVIETRTQSMPPKQQAALERLIGRYTERTKASKAFTNRNRTQVADPRTAAGFSPLLKEMVYPVVVDRSQGCRLIDLDGHEYVDLLSGYGSNFFGFGAPFIREAVTQQLERGMEIGPQTRLVEEAADLFRQLVPVDRVAYCNTGSEAVLASLRLARTVTGRDWVVVFTGGYHGIFDEVVARPTPRGSRPAAAGVPSNAVERILIQPWNDPSALDTIRERADDIAAVLVEPVQSRAPEIQPREFLQNLRTLTEQIGSVLIFDEVVCGFRTAPGGAQEVFGIQADLGTYGKVVGGGMPIGIVAGKRELMDALDGGHWEYDDNSTPTVGVTYFAGTFVRHPPALAAAVAAMKYMLEKGPTLQANLNERTSRFAGRLNTLFEEMSAPLRLEHFCSILKIAQTQPCALGQLLYYHLRLRGVHIWEGRPSFLTIAHRDTDLDLIVGAFEGAVTDMQADGFYPSPVRTSRATEPPVPGARLIRDAEGNPKWHIPEPDAHASQDEQRDSFASDPIEKTVDSTEPQREIWLAVEVGDDRATLSYNEAVGIRTGPLEPERLRRAIEALIRRHESLRLTFGDSGRTLVINQEPTLALRHHDLSESSTATSQAIRQAAVEAPFDLQQGPLIRFDLLTSDTEETAELVISAHHIICDGWSIDVIVQELAALYNADADASLADAPKFSDFAVEERRAMFGASADAAEQHWLGELGPKPTVLDLPTDRSRASAVVDAGGIPTRDVSASRYDYRIDNELSAALTALARQSKTGLSALLLGAFSGFLARITGQRDFLIGVPAAAQALTGDLGLVGHCVNLLPIRAVVNANVSVLDIASELKRRLNAGFEHQRLSFGALLQKITIDRDPTRVPLVPVMFNVDGEISPPAFDGCPSEVDSLPRIAENFEIFLNVTPQRGALILETTYATRLFDFETIRGWLEGFEASLRHLVADPNVALSGLTMVSEAQRQQQIEAWNTTTEALTVPSVLHRIADQLEHGRERPALTDAHRTLSYGELFERAGKVANRLTEAGVSPGGCVGIYCQRLTDAVVAMIAIWRAGAAFVPLDPDYPSSRLAFVIEDAHVRVILHDEAKTPELAPTGTWLSVDEAAAAPAATHPFHLPAAHDLAYVLHTSGSTGRPKGVLIEHRSLYNLIDDAAKRIGLSTDTSDADLAVFVAVTSFSFDISLREIFAPLVAGMKVVIASREAVQDGREVAALLDSVGATHMQATPSGWRALIESGWPGRPGLFALSGGEALSPSLAAELVDRVDRLENFYGPTETTIWSTSAPISQKTVGEPSEAVDIPIGRPLQNTRAYALDAFGALLPPGASSVELYIGGAGVARGYLDRPDDTQSRFLADPFQNGDERMYRTGDGVKLRSDGNLIFVGRQDQQRKIRGYRIELGEVEAALEERPEVKQAVAHIYPVGPDDDRLVGYLVARDGQTLDTSHIMTSLGEVLPPQAVPQHIVVVDAIPLTDNGKTNRKALPHPQASLADAALKGPTTDVERRLVTLWKELLRIDRLGIDQSFFQLGGHSMLGVRLLARIREDFTLELPLRTLFRDQTIEAFASRIALTQMTDDIAPDGNDTDDFEEFEF